MVPSESKVGVNCAVLPFRQTVREVGSKSSWGLLEASFSYVSSWLTHAYPITCTHRECARAPMMVLIIIDPSGFACVANVTL